MTVDELLFGILNQSPGTATPFAACAALTDDPELRGVLQQRALEIKFLRDRGMIDFAREMAHRYATELGPQLG